MTGYPEAVILEKDGKQEHFPSIRDAWLTKLRGPNDSKRIIGQANREKVRSAISNHTKISGYNIYWANLNFEQREENNTNSYNEKSLLLNEGKRKRQYAKREKIADDFYDLLIMRFKDDASIKRYLNMTNQNYKGATNNATLCYYKILSYKGDKFEDDFSILVYETLKAWGMNFRGAKLNELSAFKKSLLDNKDNLLSLTDYLIADIDKDIGLQNILKGLFFNLHLVAPEKTPLVTFSKTMHFYFNDLIAPIDRTYTCKFFEKSISTDIEKQWEFFVNVEKAYSLFSKKMDIGKYGDKERNRNIPKTIDNLVIGYIKSQESGV